MQGGSARPCWSGPKTQLGRQHPAGPKTLRERVCACGEALLHELDGTEEIAVNIGEKLWVPVDTAALSLWVDHDWLL